jgi:O-Antigen ligase
MEFFFAVFFLLFYYLRPQDWVPGLTGVQLVKPIIVVWFFALIAYRSRESPLKGLLRTPHDWIMLTYLLYVVFTATDSMDTFKGFLPLWTFYALTAQSLSTWPRLISYFKWWTLALLILAILALMIPLGIDITGGQPVMDHLKGRLSLGTWIHNNPNALGHSVIVLIPAGYFLFFWRGNAIGRFVQFPIIAGLSFWCVFLTESKGAFLVGGIMVTSLYIVGRPKYVQVIAIVISLSMGVGALSFLPRMSEMGDLRSDDGVQGRLLAWDVAREATRKNATGAGWNEFVALIDWKEGNITTYDIPKATHSSYVQIAADLGYYGLFIYIASLWCVVHTLISFRPANEMEERCRRFLWILLISTCASGWMINRQYHTEYFLLLAAAAALHRLGKARELELLPEANSETATDEVSESHLEDQIVEARPSTETAFVPIAISSERNGTEIPKKPLWNKFGILDVAICAALTWITFWVWDYILVNL